ncbi:MAG: DUF2220 family protein [Lachnospiraceae bacterium]|nr:DUF2220 family protein [Lachnospiraceae bacterium]
MLTKLTNYQKKLLLALVEQYENSKTYEGTNRVNQSFFKTPVQIYRDYESDYTDFDLIQDFENQMRELEEENLIQLEWKNGVIIKLTAADNIWDQVNTLLHRKDKHACIQEERQFYEGCIGLHPWIDSFCREQLERLASGKKAVYQLSDARILTELLYAILKNQQEFLERELSIRFFHDSKRFEKSYRSKVCTWLKKYGDFDSLLEGIDDKREMEQIILGEYSITANPSYVYLKGNGVITFSDDTSVQLKPQYPMAFSSLALEQMKSIRIHGERVLTLENLTSFNRINEEGYFYLFLSGYHNTAKQRLLIRIYQENKGLQWLHFGDLDPDGFYILEHLKRGTGIPFEAWHMEVSDLKRYEEYCKTLEKNDLIKAQSLINSDRYKDIMEYMIRNNCKLEQEIITVEL